LKPDVIVSIVIVRWCAARKAGKNYLLVDMVDAKPHLVLDLRAICLF